MCGRPTPRLLKLGRMKLPLVWFLLVTIITSFGSADPVACVGKSCSTSMAPVPLQTHEHGVKAETHEPSKAAKQVEEETSPCRTGQDIIVDRLNFAAMVPLHKSNP